MNVCMGAHERPWAQSAQLSLYLIDVDIVRASERQHRFSARNRTDCFHPNRP
jgi:hypothetical protein